MAGARQQLSAAEAQRIANARQSLVGMDRRQSDAAKRYLLEQEKHQQRLARIDRIERILKGRGDRANLARVEALRRKENADFAAFRQQMSRSLNAQQIQAIESTGQVGTRRLNASSADKRKLKSAQDAQGGQN